MTVRLQRLLHEGYRVEAIDSDDEAIVATLRRGKDIMVLHFDRAEAVSLFMMEPLAVG